VRLAPQCEVGTEGSTAVPRKSHTVTSVGQNERLNPTQENRNKGREGQHCALSFGSIINSMSHLGGVANGPNGAIRRSILTAVSSGSQCAFKVGSRLLAG
jgi:hypothetical protein